MMALSRKAEEFRKADGSLDWVKMCEYLSDAYWTGLDEFSVRRVEWNDQYFEENFVPMCQFESKVALSESILCAKAFLNWYVSGIRPEPQIRCDIVLGLMFGMTTDGSDNFLITRSLLGVKNGKILKIPRAVNYLTKFEYTSDTECATGQAGSTAPSNTGRGRAPKAITNWVIKDWYRGLWEKLETDGNTSKEKMFELKMAINYIGFLALTMLRVCATHTTVVSKHIFRQTSKDFRTLWNLKLSIGASYPPNSAMMGDFARGFARFSTSSERCLAALVYTYAGASKLGTVKRILEKGCLQSLSLTGFACYQWTLRAAEASGIGVVDILKRFQIKHKSVVSEIFKLLDEFAESEQYSWKWARIFCNGAFRPMTIKLNPSYVAEMQAIVNEA